MFVLRSKLEDDILAYRRVIVNTDLQGQAGILGRHYLKKYPFNSNH